MAAVLLAPTGCSTGPSAPPPSILPGAASEQTAADWDDVQASVSAALARTEMVLVRVDRSEPNRLVFTLRTSRDEPAVLVVERLTEEPDPVRLRATCSVGRFGDTAREREFLDLLVARLGQLEGVEVAPLDG